MKSPKITVVGSFAVGMTIRASKLPIFGETMLGTDFDMGPGGKGSNQAVATARLGARSALLAMVGDDKLAGIATDLYAAEGVDASLVRRAPNARPGWVSSFSTPRAKTSSSSTWAPTSFWTPTRRAGEAQIAASDVVMTVLEVPTSAAARAMELGRRHAKTTILNPAPARALPPAIFESVDYLTPNESELRILLNLPADDPRSSRELAQELRRRGARNIITTLGREGARFSPTRSTCAFRRSRSTSPTRPAQATPSIRASRWPRRRVDRSSKRSASAWLAAASRAPSSASFPAFPTEEARTRRTSGV